jgi:hypothetical protein
MSTTFAELVQFSAFAVGAGNARLSANLYATGTGVGKVGPLGAGVTIGFVSGGVTYSALYVVSSGVGAATAPLGVIRRLQATAAGAGTAREGVGAYGLFPALRGASGNKTYGTVVSTLPALTGYSSDPLPVPSFTSADGFLPAITGEATGLTGTVGSVDVTLPALAGLASDVLYAGVSGNLPALRGRANDEQTAIGPVARQFLFTGDNITVEFLSESGIQETLTTNSAAAASELLDALISAASTTTGGIDAIGEFSAGVSEVLQVLTALEKSGEQIIWVVNTDSGANWTYRGWDFSSFTVWNDKNYAANDQGLFELTGSDDDGTPIAASILTGKSDLGTVQHKRMAYVYVGASSDNGLQLAVHTDNGETNTYTVTAAELMGNSRTAIGKGLRSKYWQFEITNIDGGDFELESFEMRPDATIRRI